MHRNDPLGQQGPGLIYNSRHLLLLRPGERRPRHTGATGLARPQEHPAHGALHRTCAGSEVCLLCARVPNHFHGIDARYFRVAVGVFGVVEPGFGPSHAASRRVSESSAFLVFGKTLITKPPCGLGKNFVDRGTYLTSCRLVISLPVTTSMTGSTMLNTRQARFWASSRYFLSSADHCSPARKQRQAVLPCATSLRRGNQCATIL